MYSTVVSSFSLEPSPRIFCFWAPEPNFVVVRVLLFNVAGFWVLDFRVSGRWISGSSGFRGLGVQGLWFGVQGLRFFGFRVKGFGVCNLHARAGVLRLRVTH